MGGCWSLETIIQIPIPPDGIQEPLEGFEYIPLEEYIVAVEIKTEKQIYKPIVLFTNKDPYSESIFT